ncbi:putative L-lactate dehydrogenase [Schizosaccharomyces pombe]
MGIPNWLYGPTPVLQDFHLQISVKNLRRKTKNAAYDIIQRKGSTEYGVAAGLVRILAAIIRDENALLTVSGLDSYSNIGDVCFSMPRKLNKDGAHRIINAKLSKDEDAKLVESVKSIKHAIESIGLN